MKPESSIRKSVLVVAAVAFEVTPLIEKLNAQKVDHDFFAIGIGSLAAAKSSASLAALAVGRDVLFVGTCGSFSGFSKVELVTAKACHWLPVGERFGAAYAVSGTNVDFQLVKGPYTIDIKEKIVICSPSIALQPVLPPQSVFASKISECVENLELYSILPEVLASAASLSVVLGVTNQIGPLAHGQWKENFPKAARLSADFIASQIVS